MMQQDDATRCNKLFSSSDRADGLTELNWPSWPGLCHQSNLPFARAKCDHASLHSWAKPESNFEHMGQNKHHQVLLANPNQICFAKTRLPATQSTSPTIVPGLKDQSMSSLSDV